MAGLNKNKFPDLKKMIKEEPGTHVRLQSLKLPRELNLGASKQTKKVFVPNLNVKRNKEKAKEFNKKDERGKERVKEKKEKHRDNSPKYVQSSGVFSEGVGSDLRTNRWTGSRSDKENDNAPIISMPTIKKNSFQVDKKTEDSVFNKITGCDEESDDEKLPFKPIFWQNQLKKSSLIKNENSIKVEQNNLSEKTLTPIFKKIKLEPEQLLSNEFIKEEHLNTEHPSMSLWAMPPSFAGKGLSDDPNCKKIFDFCLRDMQEGQIGKILVRKSGKVEVHIGKMAYELEPEEYIPYKEDIISLNHMNKGKPKAAVLGNVKNRYSLIPHWDRLLP
ncbi:DNA-directed RNA polymerase III subunit RPC4-like [Diorhabda sublineata]|uniref:DNA-directed RNA polymerase III subunit RPC4-like n=1 Tax=Diorhabda sublineata TaxID=1163346 RepID=UPI0024E1835E|nr:DNA-directed RNA polymerase III subunit RPC4-like [Diorhabda sublineata]